MSRGHLSTNGEKAANIGVAVSKKRMAAPMLKEIGQNGAQQYSPVLLIRDERVNVEISPLHSSPGQ
jgi:hypothetical protein